MLVRANGTGLVGDYLPIDYINSNGSASDCRLVVLDSGNAGGFALILSRTISGKTYVSSQRVVVANNEQLITAYSSPSALAAAIASYGESSEAFLSSTAANQLPTAPVANSITYITVNRQNFIPGTVYTNLESWDSGSLQIHFANDVTGSVVSIDGDFWSTGGSVLEAANEQGTIANGIVSVSSLSSDWDFSSENQLKAIVVTIDGTRYEATFGAYQGGFE